MKGIELIMKNFDFQKVHEYMKQENWIWAGCGIPSIDEIKRTALNLLERAESEKTSISTGGLFAVWVNDHIELMFCIESYMAPCK